MESIENKQEIVDATDDKSEKANEIDADTKKKSWGFSFYIDLKTIITVISTVITLGLPMYLWFDAKLDKTLESRIKPYESLLEGFSLSMSGNSEKAINSLSEAFKALKGKDLSEATLAAIVDPYLNALADADNPQDYWPDFQQMLPLIKKKLPLDGERQMHFGWVYLATGHLKEAEESFTKSIRLYGADQDTTPAGESYWGLMFVALAKGNVSQAVDSLGKAEEMNPMEYSTENELKYKEWFKKQWHVIQLGLTYSPTFNDSLEEYYQALESRQN